ncbi:MAG: hypothetical protein F6K24_17170 [Okeania sp. SIO2D1]|nr:hypothetical protein [Okeania sp. SIO2D1]
MGRWGDGEMGRWGDGDLPLTSSRRGIWRDSYICTIKCISNYQDLRKFTLKPPSVGANGIRPLYVESLRKS